MFCYNCGNKLQEEAVFCDNCGAKVKENDRGFASNESYNESYETSTIDVDKLKSKIKSGADSIKQSGAFNRLISFLTKPLTTTLNVVQKSQLKEIFILASAFIGIMIINSLISSFGLGRSMFGSYYGGVFDYFSWDILFAIIIVSIVSLGISTLVTALFLKIGNAEDFMRKAFAIAVMTTGLISITGFISAIVIKVTAIGGLIVSIIGMLLYLNLYYISFMEHIRVSRDAKLILPVISITVYLLVVGFILAEFIARTFLSDFYNILNLF